MANNELSGPAVQTALYDRIQKKKNLKYNYRFVYAPETIGDLAYISHNELRLLNNMTGGCVLNMLGNKSPLVLEESTEFVVGKQQPIYKVTQESGGLLVPQETRNLRTSKTTYQQRRQLA